MDRRIFGVETEFGIRYAHEGLGNMGPEEAARKLFRPIVDWGRSSNVFLPNGARLYLDVGSHPEYATAECASLTDLVVQDKAGERLFQGLAAQAESALTAQGIPGRMHLFKNNVDSAGNSFGSHENYLLSRQADFTRLVRFLVPFLVTRQMVVGAGKVHPAGCPTAAAMLKEGGSYSFSQRADYVWEAASSATTRSRPLINTRDEPHADASQYRRLHVIVGDSNMSETTLLARMGMTDVILRMIEEHRALDDFSLKNPGQALRAVSHDLTGQTVLELADGRQMTALQMQRHYWSMATEYLARCGSPRPEMPYVMDLWRRALDAVESGDLSGIDTEVDWAIKKSLLDRSARSRETNLSSPRTAQLDLAYHDIHPERGVFALLQKKGLVRRWATEDQIQRATQEPPETRARVRGSFIRAARASGLDFTVDWVHLKINQNHGLSTVCQDPFASHHDEAERIVAALEAVPRGVGHNGSPDPLV